MVARLIGKWNTKILVRILQVVDTSECIKFNKGHPKGDVSPIVHSPLESYRLEMKATEEYHLSNSLLVRRSLTFCALMKR